MNDIGLMLADKEDYFVDGFGIIPPITIKDFIHMGEDYEKFYENIILPWRLGWKSFYTESQYTELMSTHNDISDFDMFFIKFENGERLSIQIDGTNVELVDILKRSIDFIFKCDCVVLYDYCAFQLNENQFITRINYDEICNIILKTNVCEKSKAEDPPTFENERQRDIYNKIKEGRRRTSERNKLGIKKLLNIVMVYTKYQINDVIKNMTIYQLFNTYSSLSVEDGYKLNQSYIPVVSDLSKLDLEHWSTKLK